MWQSLCSLPSTLFRQPSTVGSRLAVAFPSLHPAMPYKGLDWKLRATMAIMKRGELEALVLTLVTFHLSKHTFRGRVNLAPLDPSRPVTIQT